MSYSFALRRERGINTVTASMNKSLDELTNYVNETFDSYHQVLAALETRRARLGIEDDTPNVWSLYTFIPTAYFDFVKAFEHLSELNRPHHRNQEQNEMCDEVLRCKANTHKYLARVRYLRLWALNNYSILHAGPHFMGHHNRVGMGLRFLANDLIALAKRVQDKILELIDQGNLHTANMLQNLSLGDLAHTDLDVHEAADQAEGVEAGGSTQVPTIGDIRCWIQDQVPVTAIDASIPPKATCGVCASSLALTPGIRVSSPLYTANGGNLHCTHTLCNECWGEWSKYNRTCPCCWRFRNQSSIYDRRISAMRVRKQKQEEVAALKFCVEKAQEVVRIFRHGILNYYEPLIAPPWPIPAPAYHGDPAGIIQKLTAVESHLETIAFLLESDGP